MPFVTKKFPIVSRAILIAMALFLVASIQPPYAASVGPSIDHYLIYKFNFPIPGPGPIGLDDQFGNEDLNVIHAERFGVPVDKNGEGILRPDLHNVWWLIESATQHPVRRVVVSNQFGDATLDVQQPRYLINPAFKNTGDQLRPNFMSDNHYKCYDVVGPPLQKTITLADQFGADSSFVVEPVYLCNPATKRHLDGTAYPPPFPDEHLVCYNILIGQSGLIGVGFTDQFLNQASNELTIKDLLCVPSLKDEVVQTEPGSWGKIKSIYR